MSSCDVNDKSRYAGAKPTELKGVEDIQPEGERKSEQMRKSDALTVVVML